MKKYIITIAMVFGLGLNAFANTGKGNLDINLYKAQLITSAKQQSMSQAQINTIVSKIEAMSHSNLLDLQNLAQVYVEQNQEVASIARNSLAGGLAAALVILALGSAF